MEVKFKVQQKVVGVVLLVKCGDSKKFDLCGVFKEMFDLMIEGEFVDMVSMKCKGKFECKI